VPPEFESPHAVIEPSALGAPLPPLKPMAQSRRGVTQVLEVQVRLLVVAIPKFIQLGAPLPPLKPMAQSRRGVIQILEAQARLLVVAIPKFTKALSVE
jgi:hypothetical protein